LAVVNSVKLTKSAKIIIMLEHNFSTDRLLGQSQSFLANLGVDRNDLSTLFNKHDSAISLPDLGNLAEFGNLQKVTNNSAGDLTLRGNSQKDTLLGSNDNDKLYGLAGNDILIGGRGDDILVGGTGKDLLFGGQGNDLLVDDYDGGDIMTGGGSADTFSVGNWNAAGQNRTADLITDFAIGIDKLKIGRLGATFGNLKIENSRQGTIISDNGNQIAILQGVKANKLTKDSFIFGDPTLADRLQSDLNKGVTNTGTPGVTQAIVTPDGFTWQGAAGLSNIDTKTATKIDDTFDIGSITKAFTAATVLKLTEAGKLSLDDTLDKWLPDVAANIPDGKNITVRQLLNGSSGIANYNLDPKFDAELTADILSGSTRKWQPAELVTYIYGQPRYTASPQLSTVWSYTNTSSIIAALIVEKATGKPFAQSVREQVLTPLGLDRTYLKNYESAVGNQARGYEDVLKADGSVGQDGKVDDVTAINDPVYGNSGLVSNARDVARFSTALFGGELLQPNSQKELLTFVNEGFNYEGNGGFGLGVVKYQSSLGNFYGKGGGEIGYESGTFYFPDRGGAALSTLINRGGVLEQTFDGPKTDYIASIQRSSATTLLKSGT
jgi:D-alanyl-D-alanine carboxypeptidase